jgi:hypothetical protein
LPAQTNGSVKNDAPFDETNCLTLPETRLRCRRWREMPRRTKKRKSGHDVLGTIQRGLDYAAKVAPKVEKIYRSYSKIKRLADEASANQSSRPKIRPVHSGFGVVEKDDADSNANKGHRDKLPYF